MKPHRSSAATTVVASGSEVGSYLLADGRAKFLKNRLRMCFVQKRVRQAFKTRHCFRRIAFRDWLAPLKHDLDQSVHRVTGHASRFVERLAVGREARKCWTGDRIAALWLWVKNEGVGSCHVCDRLQMFHW